MTDLTETPQVSITDEQPTPPKGTVRNGRAFMLLRLFAGAVAGWSVWAFAVSRGARFPVSALQGHDSLNLGYVLSSPNVFLLALVLASTAMLFAKHIAVRILAIFVFPTVSIFLGMMAATIPSWDPGAYIFVVVGLGAAVLVAVSHDGSSRPARRFLAPTLALGLVLLTQAASPAVPHSAYTMPTARFNRDAVSYKCAEPAPYYAQQERGWSLMMTPSLCSRVAAYELAKVADGCYSASEAYAHLALAQGAHADSFEYAEKTAQTYLTGAWLRGRDEMESGFCVRTNKNVRTLTRSDGTGLFSVDTSAMWAAND